MTEETVVEPVPDSAAPSAGEHANKDVAVSRSGSPDEAEVKRSGDDVASDEVTVRKQRIIAEIEQDSEVYERPQRPLDEAIKAQQAEEKGTFETLIKENVALEREKRKLTENLQEATAHNEVLKVEVEGQKETLGENEVKVRSLESEVKRLEIAAAKRPDLKKGRVSKSSMNAVEDAEENNNDEEEDTEDGEDKSKQKRIRDLQFRLLRMTNDMEEKDQEKQALEKENEELKLLTLELEKEMEPGKAEQVKVRVQGQKEAEASKQEERANVVKQSGGATNSKICVIM